jgi:hypothetical protein
VLIAVYQASSNVTTITPANISPRTLPQGMFIPYFNCFTCWLQSVSALYALHSTWKRRMPLHYATMCALVFLWIEMTSWGVWKFSSTENTVHKKMGPYDSMPQ